MDRYYELDRYYEWKKFLIAHQLTTKEKEDKEYINSLYENFIENVEQL